MARRLIGSDRRQERLTQQRLTSRIANAQAREVRRSIRDAMEAGAAAFERDGRVAITSAIEDERPALQRTIGGMYQAAFDTLGGRVLEATKGLHGRHWVRKQADDPDEIFAEEQRQFIAQYQARQVAKVMQTTEQQLSRIIQSGEREGLGIGEIARKIRDRSSDMSRVRSQVISRTEVHNAGQAAQDSAVRAGGVATQKEWIAAIDDRTRDDLFSHVDADSETVGIGGEFMATGERLRYPGDPAGSAGNIIMCRCGTGHIVD